MMSTTKRRRIGDTPADGASKLSSGLSATASSSPGDQQSTVEAQGLISDRHLPAWLSIFRSGNGDARSLGRLATGTSKALTQLLESGNGTTDDVWVMLCHRHFDKAMYEAIPEQVRESLGPRRLLAQVGAGPAKRYTNAAKKASLKEPILTAENTTFFVKVWEGDRVIISQAVTGDALGKLFDNKFVPDIRNECQFHYHCGDEDHYYDSSGNEHPGDVMMELCKPILVDKADLSGCTATVHLLFSVDGESKCIPLLQYPSEGFTSNNVLCHCSEEDYDGREHMVHGELRLGCWARNGIAVSHRRETFLDLDDEGDAILKLISAQDERDESIINALRLSLNFVYFHPFIDEENGWNPEDQETYLTHFTIRFHAEQKYDAYVCDNWQCRMMYEPPDASHLWKISGVTIPHLLPHIKGIKMIKPEK